VTIPFDLLSKQPSPEDYFDALKDAGFFDPKNNAGPVPSNEPGFVQIPFWPALTYLQAVAKRAGQTDDLSLAEKILGVVRSVTNFRDDNGEPRDNYHSYYRFAEIIGELPLRSISIDDVKLIRVWLTSRFEHGLVGSSLAKGLLKRLLASDEQRDTELAIRVMKECMAYEWLRPSAVHWWDHTIGKSISRLAPNPRGRRPSTAATIMGAATKASDNVMRIERSLFLSRVAMDSMDWPRSRTSSSNQRWALRKDSAKTARA
jgi:hypothetical protein